MNSVGFAFITHVDMIVYKFSWLASAENILSEEKNKTICHSNFLAIFK